MRVSSSTLELRTSDMGHWVLKASKGGVLRDGMGDTRSVEGADSAQPLGDELTSRAKNELSSTAVCVVSEESGRYGIGDCSPTFAGDPDVPVRSTVSKEDEGNAQRLRQPRERVRSP